MEERHFVQTLVEGLNHSENYLIPNYRNAAMKIPDDATHINDLDFIYMLYGTTDFKKIKTGNTRNCKTFFTSKIRDFSNLTRPRAIITSDGRIFVEQNNLLSKEYLGLLEKEIIPEAGKFFSAQNYKG